MGGVISIVLRIRVRRMLIRGLLWRRGRMIIMAKGMNSSSRIELLVFSIILLFLILYILPVNNLKKQYTLYKPSSHHSNSSPIPSSYSNVSFSNIYFKLFLLSSIFFFAYSLLIMANLYELIYL